MGNSSSASYIEWLAWDRVWWASEVVGKVWLCPQQGRALKFYDKYSIVILCQVNIVASHRLIKTLYIRQSFPSQPMQ